MSAVPKPYVTPLEYLIRERGAETKSEYFRGEVFALAGASRAHNLIVGNLVTALNLRLRDCDCDAYPSDMRVQVSVPGLYTYPDVTVVCGEPQFEDETADTSRKGLPDLFRKTRVVDAGGRPTVESRQTVRTRKETLFMSAVPKPFLTPQEYLARERQAETKSEYLRGEVFAMSGASRAHNLIAGNTLIAIGPQLRDRECEVYPGDMRVKVSPTGLYTYPDVTVVCGEPEFEDAEVDTLLNPRVLVEVLSPSTADYDRGGKFTHYRRLPSLHEYVLISQDRPLVEHYVRQGQDEWLLTEQSSLQDTLVLSSIRCQLPLSEIYLKVRLEADGEGQHGGAGTG